MSDFKPQRALLIAIQHVHREAGSTFGELPNLPLAHQGATALRGFLIRNCHSTASIRSITPFLDSRGYHEDDVTVMMDDKSHPKHLWPTRDRIVRIFTWPVRSLFLKLSL